MFWADQIVSEIIEKRKPPFTVYDWWAPSGFAHAGHIRTFLLHQAVYQGLKMHGYDTTYYYGFDNIDPMDGFPPGLPESYRQYLGVPLCNIPSPIEGFSSLADYYSSAYLEAMETLGVYPQVPTNSEMYRAGQFNDAITIVLDNAQKIRDIYADFGAERPIDWHPFQVICPQCGKIGTTYVYGWDGKEVSFRCEPNLVKWAQGCGHEGTMSPYNGNGKMPYKVEWAAKWLVLNTDYEGGGKDHFSKNGSHDYALKIVKEIFEAEAAIGYPNEFFLMGGAKMSSSKGNVVTAGDAAKLVPPHIMRFFVYRVAPNRQLEFNPEGDTIPKIYDEFDRGLLAIGENPEANEARAAVYAYQDDTDYPVFALRFSKVVFLIQMPHIDIKAMAEAEKGTPLTPAEMLELNSRIEYARRWLGTFALESDRVELQPTLPEVQLSTEQIAYVTNVSEQLKNANWSGESIHSVLHDTKNAMELSPKEAFGALYKIFLNKDSGPQAGWFLAALDKEFVMARLNEATGGLSNA